MTDTERPTVAALLADSMALTADDRACLARYLALCVGSGLELEPNSLRRTNDHDLRQLFGGAQ